MKFKLSSSSTKCNSAFKNDAMNTLILLSTIFSIILVAANAAPQRQLGLPDLTDISSQILQPVLRPPRSPAKIPEESKEALEGSETAYYRYAYIYPYYYPATYPVVYVR